ncbi:hypothetical protein HN014_03730 [Aquimarina sp. TRL1]|uniref:hypothetical protein n=1 Tax=Aquimarina sp. (strain TRL1) TaxID=2736252 RepID=UPI00158E2A8E|nr:hypothetical protein [Aquimarina sp. TRL1]QKX04051.1 hypothetical protein HN014_03730 [Aquimarina sp. TRL1]
MALDFHKADNNEHLFGLEDHQYANLEAIFTAFKNWSGVVIDPYGDTSLTIENQKTIVRIIDTYIHKEDLNVDKQKTIDIIEFSAMMKYFSNKGIVLKIVGD